MNISEQVEYLMQGTQYGDDSTQKVMADELRERLMKAEQTGRCLKVYCGYDPRKPDLHLGHTVTMRKLRQFQELGHEVTFLIGTYTSLIGDPSDQDKLRNILTPRESEQNARTYAEQAFRILDRSQTKVRYNAEWLAGLTFADFIRLASNFTIQQFLTREAFRVRWDKGDAIYLHETFYSIMQGYDAFALEADVQVGGSDQLFNILTAARKVMASLGVRPNIAIILGILPGTDGVVKMSKSLGNHIPISTTPEDMYGKTMSIPDFAMPGYCRLVTRWSPSQIARFEQEIQAGQLHPRDAKMQLAYEITATFYGEEAAERAQAEFVQLFQQHAIPADIPEFQLGTGMSVLDVLVTTGLASSRAEGRRLMEQKGVRLDGSILSNPNQPFPGPGVLQAGKRKFVRVWG